ncbi:PAS domain S-box protein [Leptospira ellinghausenii]|uniref:PAS domain S-box protein n=1 Tax=Leptospira ellinghausenii TaxID=1917822 RepID=A0A2P2D7Y9_9LEPT|nr:PAS domain S-box protein [Leptospira ellinghausenii]GBF40745.1 PAS domain S-box protein [Leptospira ellinghausenii]
MNQVIFEDNKEDGKSNEHYDSLPVAFLQISKQGRINFINSEATELFSITQSDLHQKSFTTLLSEKSKESFHTFISTICSGKNKNSCLAEIIVRQNLTKQVSLYGNLSLDGDWIQLIVVESTDEKETDITYKKEFEDISNVAQVGRWELNLVTGTLKWSKKIYEIFELDPNLFQPSYETFLSVIHPDDREKVNQAYSQSLIDKKKYEIEHRLILSDGRIKWVRETCYSIFDPQGNPEISIGTCQDITKQKEMEIHLKESETKYSNLVENTASLVWSLDENGHFRYINPAWEKLLGYPKEEILDRSFLDFQPSVIATRDKKAFEKFSLGDDDSIKIGYETLFISKTGEAKYLIFYPTPLYNESGQFIGSHGTANDITFKRTLDLKLEETYFELGQRQYAIDQHAIVAITDLNADIIYVNKKFCEISKYTRDELIGENHRIINSGYHPAEFFKNLYKTIKSGNTWHGEIRNRAKDGTFYWVATTIAPIKNARGVIEKYLSIRTDITEIKEADEKIKSLLNEKALILVEVHHRIKNNMNTIYSLLKMEANSQKDILHKTILLDASNRVRSMMLLYDKLYRSENTDTISIKDYFPTLISEILNIFPNHEKITTDIHVEPVAINTKILSSIGIIINELVTNSMKYSFNEGQSGKITFHAKIQNQILMINYEDDGIPINPTILLQSTNSFGLNLINMLVKQLKGIVHIENSNGTKYKIEIKI